MRKKLLNDLTDEEVFYELENKHLQVCICLFLRKNCS